MISVREEVKHNIWWQVKTGNSSFWFDNWTKQGALYFVEGDTVIEEELEVKDFVTAGNWDEIKLLTKLSPEMTDYILESIKPPITGNEIDQPWWMGNPQGSFTVKSAWQLMRQKKECRKDFEFLGVRDCHSR
uniref:Putative ovule protein n=1 Tax=Solanum chacoense TaxID=4108 RepID=A0A0V0I4G5_SOLCH